MQSPFIILYNILKPSIHQHNKAQPQANTFHSSSSFVHWPDSPEGISSTYTWSTFGLVGYVVLDIFFLQVCEVSITILSLSCSPSNSQWPQGPQNSDFWLQLRQRAESRCQIYSPLCDVQTHTVCSTDCDIRRIFLPNQLLTLQVIDRTPTVLYLTPPCSSLHFPLVRRQEWGRASHLWLPRDSLCQSWQQKEMRDINSYIDCRVIFSTINVAVVFSFTQKEETRNI